MRHVDEGELHAYLDGAVDAFGPGELESLERHLAECADCRARLDAERQIRARAGALLEIGPDAGAADLPAYEEVVHDSRPRTARRSARGWLVLPWAATVALALGIGWLARANDGPEQAASLALESAEPDAATVPDIGAPRAAVLAETTETPALQSAVPREVGPPVPAPPAAPREAGSPAPAPPAVPREAAAPAPAPPPVVADAGAPAEPPVATARSIPPSAPVMHDPSPPVVAPARAAESGVVALRAEGESPEGNVVIRGVVREQGGQPLAGATVRVEDSQIAVITRADGSYSLTVPRSLLDSADVRNLRVAMVGFGADQRRLDPSAQQVDTQNFALQRVPIQLEGLVAAGYGRSRYSHASRIDRRRAEQLLGRELPVIPVLRVLGIERQMVDDESVVVIRQRLESGATVELEVSPPERRDHDARADADEPVEEIGAREGAEGAELELRVRGMTVTVTAPVPLAQLREIAARIR